MASRIDAITITCRDHETLGPFWRQVLDLQEDPDDPNLPGDPVTVYLTEPLRIRFLFQPTEPGAEFVPRIHFDVDAVDRTRDEEVARLQLLGARVVADRRNDDGSGWVTVADPDGYELCVQRGQEERDGSEESEGSPVRG